MGGGGAIQKSLDTEQFRKLQKILLNTGKGIKFITFFKIQICFFIINGTNALQTIFLGRIRYLGKINFFVIIWCTVCTPT